MLGKMRVRRLKNCGLIGSIVAALGIAMASSVLDKIAAVSANQLLLFILVTIVGFGIIFIPLIVILKKYRKYANDLVRRKKKLGECQSRIKMSAESRVKKSTFHW